GRVPPCHRIAAGTAGVVGGAPLPYRGRDASRPVPPYPACRTGGAVCAVREFLVKEWRLPTRQTSRNCKLKYSFNGSILRTSAALRSRLLSRAFSKFLGTSSLRLHNILHTSVQQSCRPLEV